MVYYWAGLETKAVKDGRQAEACQTQQRNPAQPNGEWRNDRKRQDEQENAHE